MDERRIEEEYLSNALARLKEYSADIFARKAMIDASVEENRKHFDPENIEQYSELLLNTRLQSSLSTRAKTIVKSLDKPYFTRVDFTDDGEQGKTDGVQRYYIGKTSLFDKDENPIIVDWRAPVSNLYYEGRLGHAEYESPGGLVTGEISLKRQYVIEGGRLDDFFDIDVTASDDFLQAALGGSKDNRLKDIVSTIQAEQNRVIRAGMNRALIVQGAAGSGKTTIALHRVAYLLYHYEDRLSPRNIMLLAPNKFFISYISEVLPDLGVEDIYQTTWTEFAESYVEQPLNVKPAGAKLGYMTENPDRAAYVARVSRVKGSLRFKAAVGRYIDGVIDGLFPVADFELDGETLMSYNDIKRLIVGEYDFLPVQKRLNEIKKYLSNALRREKPRILARIEAECDAKIARLKEEYMVDSDQRRAWIVRLFDARDERLKRVGNKAKTLVKDYINGAKLKTAAQYYADLTGDAETLIKAAAGLLPERDCAALSSATAVSVRGGYWEEDDLPSIVYIHSRLFGGGRLDGEDLDIRHVIIDEAQDAPPFQLAALQDITRTDSFSIFGDLRQGIFEHKGISDWNLVMNGRVFGETDYVTLAQSYRTTVEIMNAANKAAIKMPYGDEAPLAVPVIRHGTDVTFTRTDGADDLADKINAVIDSFAAQGFHSAAVVCSRLGECERLFPLLRGVKPLYGNEDGYGGGFVILPAYLSKGLEFDGVIIADAGAGKYSPTRPIDVKTLYVAMTRALHELKVFYEGELTEILK